jgi:hypothetical protein
LSYIVKFYLKKKKKKERGEGRRKGREGKKPKLSHAFIPRYSEGKDCCFKPDCAKTQQDPYLNKISQGGGFSYTCNPSYVGGIGRRSVV